MLSYKCLPTFLPHEPGLVKGSPPWRAPTCPEKKENMKALLPKREYLIDKILPSRCVHLMGGPSGSGKTRWMFQAIAEWQQQGTVLGLPAKPLCKLAYVALDRTEESISETLSAIDPTIDMDWGSLLGVTISASKLVDLYSSYDLLIVDGIAGLVPDGKIIDYYTVSKFLTNLTFQAKNANLTVLGILHTAKTKENESFKNPRQRIAGSVSWAAYSESIFILDPINPDDPTRNLRRLWVLPRNSSEFTKDYEFSPEGRLVDITAPPKPPNKEEEAQQVIQAIVAIDGTSRKDIIDACLALGASRATIDRAIDALLAAGSIYREVKGMYKPGPGLVQ